MGDANGGIGGIDTLAAGTGGAIDINPQILGVDIRIDRISFRENRNCDRRGVNSALGFSGRDALDAMNAALIFQAAENPLPLIKTIISFKPPTPVSLRPSSSSFHLWRSA